jgi:hypothetical protein
MGITLRKRLYRGQRYPASDDAVWFPVEAVERSRHDGWVYNLRVQEDESYTTAWGVAHNCSNCINPKLELVSQILTAFVAPRLASGSERLVLYYEPAHAYDPDLELTRWKFLAGLAAADNNEIRTSLGLPPRPGGNVALMPPGVTPYDLETSYDFSEPEPAPAPALPGAGAGPAANGHAGNGKPPGGNGSGGGNGKPPAGGGIDDVDNIDRGTDRSFRRLGVYVSGG